MSNSKCPRCNSNVTFASVRRNSYIQMACIRCNKEWRIPIEAKVELVENKRELDKGEV